MVFVENQPVPPRMNCVFQMPIVARTRATRGAEFAERAGVMPTGFRVPKMRIVARGSCATRRTIYAPRYRARNMVIRVLRTGIVAVCTATDRVNARRLAPRARKPQATNVARGFVMAAPARIVVLQA